MRQTTARDIDSIFPFARHVCDDDARGGIGIGIGDIARATTVRDRAAARDDAGETKR